MDHDVTTLRDHAAILRRRWRILFICTALGILIALGLSALQAPLYRSEALVLLEPERVSTSATVMDPDEVATQTRVIASAQVAERVVESLSLDEEPDELLRSVTVEVLEQTRTVAITAERSSAAESAAVANAFASDYIAYRTQSAVTAVTSIRDGLIAQLGTIVGELSTVRAALADGRSQLLEAREQSLVTREAEVRTEISLAQADTPDGAIGGQVLREAQPPGNAAQPRPVQAALFGGLLGLIVGVLLAYVRDRFDDGIRDELRLRSAVGGQPVLGRIPQEQGDGSRLITLLEPHSAQSEAYRTLTTNIRFLSSGHGDRTRGEMLVITSAVSGEGKTTLAANVAVTAARVGLRVILVDADLRNPSVAARFGVDLPLGLSHVLAEQADLEKVLFDADALDVPGLALIAAGLVPPNPAELLAGPHALAVWRELRQLADLVVVDTAPVLNVADTLEIVGEADLTVLSARYKLSRVHRIESTVERIRQVGGAVSGVAWCELPRKDFAAVYGTDRPA